MVATKTMGTGARPTAGPKRPARRHLRLRLRAAGGVRTPAGDLEGPAAATHGEFMKRALALAERGRGKTDPNPMVGCVIVGEGGAVVGEGFHPEAGQPHAEVFALRAAGNAAEGATAYVTLEPCNHYGRTPPCSLALVAAKVATVVVGMVDPNPLVSGSGIDTLTTNGIDVVVGVEEAACKELNVDFIERMTQTSSS